MGGLLALEDRVVSHTNQQLLSSYNNNELSQLSTDSDNKRVTRCIIKEIKLDFKPETQHGNPRLIPSMYVANSLKD